MMKYFERKSYLHLPEEEQKAIQAACEKEVVRQITELGLDLQCDIAKLNVVLLHEAFGFSEENLYRYLSVLKRYYHKIAHCENRDELKAHFDNIMPSIFKDGFPEKYLEEIRNRK